jgi:antibiotic biosynthesis monooxygenase (ABM) superfamily enzyme
LSTIMESRSISQCGRTEAIATVDDSAVEQSQEALSRSQAEQPTAPAPPRYKLALLTWAAAYTVITLILAVLGPAMAAWPLPLRTLLLSAVMVAALTWVVIPVLSRLLRGWLASPSPRKRLPAHHRGPSVRAAAGGSARRLG